MLLERSIVDIADNTGAVSVRLFAINGKNNRQTISIGDTAMGSVIKATAASKYPKGSKVKIVVVATRRKIQRKDGSSIKFSANRAVIVNKANNEMAGTRVFGPVARELREVEAYKKIISLAEEVL